MDAPDYNDSVVGYATNPRWYVFDNAAIVGIKPRHCKIKLSNFIPLHDQLSLGSTPVETTSFNETPYLYIGRDTTGNFPYTAIRPNADKRIMLQNGGWADYIGDGAAAPGASFNPLNYFGTVHTMKFGEEYEWSFKCNDPGPWIFNNVTSNNIASNSRITFLPFRIPNTSTYTANHTNWQLLGGTLAASTPLSWYTDIEDEARWSGQFEMGAVMAWMPSVYDSSGVLMKLRASLVQETEFTCTAYVQNDWQITPNVHNIPSLAQRREQYVLENHYMTPRDDPVATQTLWPWRSLGMHH